VIGRRDRLPAGLPEEIARAEEATRSGERLHLRIAIDYSGRDAILAAALSAANDRDLTRDGLARRLADGAPAPDVDLLIRTSGEQRLSDFLLWESAYAELHFTPCLWPDFGAEQLAEAMASFWGRQRRFGGLQAAA
jgi:undecaprenyl diphosphate synthase